MTNNQYPKTKPIISLIACVAKDRGIGKDNKLLFQIPEDLRYFKKITLNHTIVMGYNTYKSIGHALQGRINIVLSTKIRLLHDAKICRGVDEVIKNIQDEDEVFIIGGQKVYEQFLPMADKLYLTLVDAILPADTYFPNYSDFDNIKVVSDGQYKDLKYQFLELTK